MWHHYEKDYKLFIWILVKSEPKTKKKQTNKQTKNPHKILSTVHAVHENIHFPVA
jgi:hypothetical protein